MVILGNRKKYPAYPDVYRHHTVHNISHFYNCVLCNPDLGESDALIKKQMTEWCVKITIVMINFAE